VAAAAWISHLLHQSDERRISEMDKKRGPFFAAQQARGGNDGTLCRGAKRCWNWQFDQEDRLLNDNSAHRSLHPEMMNSK
jgi:hypothetical protein